MKSKWFISALAGSIIFAIALVVYVKASARSTAALQPEQSDSQVVPSLMQEVKLLRMAIERSNTTMPAFHVLLERTRLQNDIVSQINHQAYDAKLEEERSRLETEQYDHRIDDLKEKQLTNYTPETENEIKELKIQADQSRKRAELYQQQLGQLNAQLGPEQNKLNNFTAELDRLQAELTSAPKR